MPVIEELFYNNCKSAQAKIPFIEWLIAIVKIVKILTLPDFQIGRLFEILTLEIGRTVSRKFMFHYQLAKNRSQNSEKHFAANQKLLAEFSSFNSEPEASEETSESCSISMELRCLCELCECAPACLHRQSVSLP